MGKGPDSAVFWVNLQLGLFADHAQNWLELERLHNVALDLELAGHEESLRVGLAKE